MHIFLWHYTKWRQLVGSFLKVGCHVEFETMSVIFFILCYMKIHWSLHPLQFEWLFLLYMALCHQALVTWKILIHWDLHSEICTHKRMGVKRQVWCYYENSFDKADPLKGLGNPQRSQDYSWRTTGLDQSQRSSHPRNLSNHSFIHSFHKYVLTTTPCQQLFWALRIPQWTKQSLALVQLTFSWGRQAIRKHSHVGQC